MTASRFEQLPAGTQSATRREGIARQRMARRRVNDALNATAVSVAGTHRLVMCECGVLGCNAMLEVAVDDYTTRRGHPQRFFMTDGHQVADLDTVVCRCSSIALIVECEPV